MSSISDRSLTAVFVLFVISTLAECRPQQQTYLPPAGLQQSQSKNNPQTFYAPPATGLAGQLHQLPFLTSSSNQHQQLQQQPQQQQQQQQQQQLQQQQQQQFSEQPIQLQIPIPNDGVQEKKIYVQLPPQPQQPYPQQPQYRYPPRKHYKIILVRSPSPPTPPPAPVLPEIEEQTLVYVLVQKPDTSSVAELQQQQQQSFKLNKPEVYFIKYKANEQRADDGGIGGGSGNSISPEAIEKSIQHQLSNNLEGASGNGGGYSYDGSRKREAKHLKQNNEDEEANTVMKDENQK